MLSFAQHKNISTLENRMIVTDNNFYKNTQGLKIKLANRTKKKRKVKSLV